MWCNESISIFFIYYNLQLTLLSQIKITLTLKQLNSILKKCWKMTLHKRKETWGVFLCCYWVEAMCLGTSQSVPWCESLLSVRVCHLEALEKGNTLLANNQKPKNSSFLMTQITLNFSNATSFDNNKKVHVKKVHVLKKICSMITKTYVVWYLFQLNLIRSFWIIIS